MAERVLTLGRKAEVDKRQSGIGEAAPGEKSRREFAGHGKKEGGRERDERGEQGGKRIRERWRFHHETFSKEWNVRSI